MGKLTISMAIFNSYVTNYQRVYGWMYPDWWLMMIKIVSLQIFMIDGCIFFGWMWRPFTKLRNSASCCYPFCHISVPNGSVQVRQYLLAFQWPKYLEAVLAGRALRKAGARKKCWIRRSAFELSPVVDSSHFANIRYPPYVLDHGFLGAFKLGDRDYASWRQIRVILQLLRKSWTLFQASYN